MDKLRSVPVRAPETSRRPKLSERVFLDGLANPGWLLSQLSTVALNELRTIISNVSPESPRAHAGGFARDGPEVSGLRQHANRSCRRPRTDSNRKPPSSRSRSLRCAGRTVKLAVGIVSVIIRDILAAYTFAMVWRRFAFAFLSFFVSLQHVCVREEEVAGNSP